MLIKDRCRSLIDSKFDLCYYRRLLLGRIRREALEVGVERVLSSGGKSDFYVDMKKVTLDPEGAFLTATVVSNMIPDGTDAVGGLTLGADPIVSVLTLLSYFLGRPLPAFIVRKEPKRHGALNLIEGKLVPGSRVVIVEDVVTTGRSVLLAVDAVEKEGCEVVKIISLVDRQEGAKERLARWEYDPVYTKDEVLAEYRRVLRDLTW